MNNKNLKAQFIGLHPSKLLNRILLAVLTTLSIAQHAFGQDLPLNASVVTALGDAPFERTEQRQPCADTAPLKKPLFGDLHVHTLYSFDSYISSQRNDPWDAYRYAKGEPITLPDEDGEQTIQAQIQRPLDFTAVTDHAELLGPIRICTDDPGKLGYWWPHCVMTRSSIYIVQLIAASGWAGNAVTSTDGGSPGFACTLSDCDQAHLDAWKNIQQAAEEHYDRSSDCSFTTFVAYEYTDAPEYKNMHRNVIFRNERVTETAISTYDTGSYNFPELWVKLRDQCIDGGEGCDVMAIPHNSNLAGGLMFRDPESEREVEDRLYFEPVIELVQHKAASECRYDRLVDKGVDTNDKLCDFEQAFSDNLSMLGTLHGKVATESAAPVGIEDFARRNMARNALKDGLAIGQKDGVNPFQFGFIASTDTHSATPGGSEEDNYRGSLGRRDSGYRNVQDHFFDNPGGLAVVWAEENARDSIFSAMRRKETYATSGTRPTVRFFSGWDYGEDLCQSSSMLEQAYAGGVPMGGQLTPLNKQSESPRFLVSASKDPGSPGHPGNDLQRIQVVKGWVDSNGVTQEKVFDVAGERNDATVDPQSCAPVGKGAASLCAVWRDDQYDASQDAFYYARVLENPSCRWSTYQCQAAGVNPFAKDCKALAEAATEAAQERGAKGDVYGNCCLDPEQQPFYTPIIQERAWTSPIWLGAAKER